MKIKIFGVFIALFLVSSGFAYENPKETELLFMAKKAYEDGFYTVSQEMLEKFQKTYSNSPEIDQARLLNGQCYFQQGRYLEALDIFEKLFKESKCAGFKDAIYFWMAEVYFKGSDFKKAAEFYQKLIIQFPQSAYAAASYYSLGWCLAQEGRYRQALQVFKSLLEKFPGEPQSKDAVFKLIECLYNLKEYSELKDKVKPVFKSYANDSLRLPYLYFYLAESEYYLDNFEEASRNYLKSAQAAKEERVQALANLGLGWAYFKLAKYKEAEDVFAKIKQSSLDKKSLDILILGQALLMSSVNRVYEARKLYEQLASLSGDPVVCAQAYLGCGDAFYNLAEYAQAVNAYKEGLKKIDELNVSLDEKADVAGELADKLRYNLALAYIKEGQINSGISVLEGICAKSNNHASDASVLFQLGQAYQQEGNFIKAEEIYSKIIKDYPDSAGLDYAQYQLGFLQLKNLKHDQAADSFRLLLKDYPQSRFLGDTVYFLGAAYFQKADYASSCQVLFRFQNEFKDHPLRPQAFYMLGASLLSLERIDEALEVFKSILKLNFQDTELLQKTEYEIADCYYKLGKESEAFRLFKLLRAKYPNAEITADVLWWLGQYYYRANDLELARRYFDSLARDFPGSRLVGGAFYARGLIFYKLGDYKGAKLNYDKSLKAADAKDIANIRFNLAEALEADSEFDAAIEQYLLAADLYVQPSYSSVTALLRAAKLNEDKGNFKQASEIYKRIIRQGTDEAKFAQERVEWINANH